MLLIKLFYVVILKFRAIFFQNTSSHFFLKKKIINVILVFSTQISIAGEYFEQKYLRSSKRKKKNFFIYKNCFYKFAPFAL